MTAPTRLNPPIWTAISLFEASHRSMLNHTAAWETWAAQPQSSVADKL